MQSFGWNEGTYMVVDKQLALRVFAKIVQHGERIETGHLYQGMLAESSDDGYTVRLSDHATSLDLFFHNKHQVNYERRADLDKFIQCLDRIDKQL